MIKAMKRRAKAAKFSLIIIISIVGLFLLLFAGYSIVFAHKIYSNQFIDDIDFGGKTKNQAREILQQRTKEFLDNNIDLKYEDGAKNVKDYQISPSDLGVSYDIDATIGSLWSYGRSSNIFLSFWQQLKSVLAKNKTNAAYSINRDNLNKKIADIGVELDNPEKDFSLSYSDGSFSLTTERKEGQRINQDKIKEEISDKIASIKNEPINFKSEVYKPQIDEAKAISRLREANGILDGGELTLISGDQKYFVDRGTIASFIGSRPKKDDLEIIFNEEKIKTYVDKLAAAINITPQNAILTVSGSKAVVFQTARVGKTLDGVQTVVDIENSLSARIPGRTSVADPKQINLKVDIKKPDITDDMVDNMGIRELIASGTTDFRSSPANRIHNINIGMTAINGTLIKPGEEFSTLGKLGKIDASTGYLPELVIRNNQTLPDYGGGLCQVSTTLFRAALNAGLKITERSNHSYRVSYYEPPVGMDATIYDPAPDFKFVNNYDSYLLVQGHISGTKITFEIYGTKDNRIINIATPNIYDYVEPPAPERVETNTLPAGQTQQVQKAHQGATASFNYHVEKNGQVLQDKNFVSKYVALPEKWLVGKGDVATPNPDATQPAPPADPAPAPNPTQ